MTENLVNSDLKTLNLQFLMIVRECARYHPMDAIWKFNLTDADIQRISSMTIEQLTELASCGRAVLTILPSATTTPLNILAALS